MRSTDWLKIKTARRQEVAIVGFTAPRGSRPHFGALVLAVREGNAWRYAGLVGTGFSHATLEEIYGLLRPLRTASSPFRARVKNEAATMWVTPKLVAEVKLTEWTLPARCATRCSSACAPTRSSGSRRRGVRCADKPGKSGAPLVTAATGAPLSACAAGFM